MREPPEKFLKAYETLLKLYPSHFQNMYGEEMVVVFHKACVDSINNSGWAIGKLIFRELRDLPANLIREYWSEIWRNSMDTHNNLREPLPKSILRGIISFSIAFIFIFFIYCLIDTLLNSGNDPWYGNTLWNGTLYLQPAALAYGLGALIIGISHNKRKAWFSALGSFLVYTVLDRIWLFLPWEQRNTLISTGLEPYITSTVIGIFVGGITGIIQRGWKKTGWYALAGVIGFNLGWVLRSVVVNFLFALSPHNVKIGAPWYFLLYVIPVIFYGAGIGILMGLTAIGVNKRTPIINQE